MDSISHFMTKIHWSKNKSVDYNISNSDLNRISSKINNIVTQHTNKNIIPTSIATSMATSIATKTAWAEMDVRRYMLTHHKGCLVTLEARHAHLQGTEEFSCLYSHCRLTWKSSIWSFNILSVLHRLLGVDSMVIWYKNVLVNSWIPESFP